MIVNIIISIIFLILLGFTVIGGRYAEAGIGETPLMYKSVIVQFILNISMLAFLGLSIFLLFFYSWKLFLLLLATGFIMETFLIIPLLERVLYLLTKKH